MTPLAEDKTWTVSNAEYHADTTHISHSSLDVFIGSIPEYHGRYVTRKLPQPEPSPAMKLGSALDAMLLEPDTWKQLFAVDINVDGRTKEGKKARADFAAEHAGKTIITEAHLEQVMGMCNAVAAHEEAASMLALPGDNQKAVRWLCPDTGILCKAKFDRLTCRGPIIDVKTAAHPTPPKWEKSVADFGYHRQAAFYLDARWHALDDPCHDFFFIVIGSSPPHEVIIYQLERDAIELGRRQNHDALRELQICRETDTWASRWTEIQMARLPRWAYQQ